MPNQTQNLFTGNDLALQGMTQAYNHAVSVQPHWGDVVMIRAKEYLKLFGPGYEFLCENLRNYCEANGVSDPPSKRSYGAVMLKLANTGLIENTGKTNKVKNRLAHNANSAVWIILKVEI